MITKLEYVILGVFTLGILGVVVVTTFAMMWGLLPSLLGVFCLIVCLIALWSISFYIGTRQ